MKLPIKLFAINLILLSLFGCENEKTVTPLPFEVESFVFNDNFKFELNMLKIKAGVSGGTPEQWAATAKTIAEYVAVEGITNIDVGIYNRNVKQKQGVLFRLLAEANYAPDPAHSIYADGWTWKARTANNPVSQNTVDMVDEYNAIATDYKNQGLSGDDPYDKAADIVIKKYGLSKDWVEPVGNDMNDFNIESLDVDGTSVKSMLEILRQCAEGKLKHQTVSCDT